MFGEYFFTGLLAAGVVIYLVYQIRVRYFERCEKCANQMRVVTKPESAEKEPSSGLFSKPRRKQLFYRCGYCGHTQSRKLISHE